MTYTQEKFNLKDFKERKIIFVADDPEKSKAIASLNFASVYFPDNLQAAFIDEIEKDPTPYRTRLFIFTSDKLVNFQRELNKSELLTIKRNLNFSDLKADELKKIEQEAEEARKKTLKAGYAIYKRDNSAGGKIAEFQAYITNRANTPTISTGFKKFDSLIGGGLESRLYVLGATTGLGKSIFAEQVADYISGQGSPVFYFALEMGTFELMGRSISRISFQTEKKKDMPNFNNCKTARNIADGKNWIGYNHAERDLMCASFEHYRLSASNLFIFDSSSSAEGNITINDIERQIGAFTALTDRPPVVIVDYLQLLPPENDRLTDKAATDRNITALKRLSVKYQSPVIAISSLNREGYKAGITKQELTLASLKESGAIEYTADIVAIMDYLEAPKKDKAITEPTQIKLKILKNRIGQNHGEIIFNLWGGFSCFEEID